MSIPRNTMEFITLENIPESQIFDCMFEGFKDYFVSIPHSYNYWRNRYQAARVNWEFSIGAIDQGKLVALIIHGIDVFDKKLTAFNTGTCVLASHRGQALVDQMYQFILPKLIDSKIQTCLLEVIQENKRALRVYERIGFSIVQNYHCFKGKLSHDIQGRSEIEMIKQPGQVIPPRHNSWDNCNAAISLNQNKINHFAFIRNKKKLGTMSLDEEKGVIYQIEKSASADWGDIFYHLRSKEIKYNNVPEARGDLIDALKSYHVEEVVLQYLMEMDLVQSNQS